MIKYILYAVILIALYYFGMKYLEHKKYYNFFHKELGFGDNYLKRFTNEELKICYDYVKNYSNKGIALTPSNNPVFYAKVKAINDKFNIFSSIK